MSENNIEQRAVIVQILEAELQGKDPQHLHRVADLILNALDLQGEPESAPEPTVGGFTINDILGQANADGLALTREEAETVFEHGKYNQDAEIGVNWAVISGWLTNVGVGRELTQEELARAQAGEVIVVPGPWYENHYTCPTCGEEWTDEWSCGCDDECPKCGEKNISPHETIDLNETTNEQSERTHPPGDAPGTGELVPGA